MRRAHRGREGSPVAVYAPAVDRNVVVTCAVQLCEWKHFFPSCEAQVPPVTDHMLARNPILASALRHGRFSFWRYELHVIMRVPYLGDVLSLIILRLCPVTAGSYVPNPS